MADKTPSLATLASSIKQGISSALKDLHTAMPGIVESFDAATQLASVQPAVRRVFITRDSTNIEILTPSDLPILINVPVIFPRGGGFSMTFPVKKGDECLLVFCERSIDNWHATGKVKIPGARRFHDLSDATAFVGLSSIPNKVPNYDDTNLQIKKDDDSVSITLNADGSLDIHTDSDTNIDSSADVNVDCVDAVLNATGDVTVIAAATATLTAAAIVINGPTTINGDTQINGTLASNTSVAAPIIAAATSLTVAAKEMSGHTHPQGVDSNNDTQQNTGAPV